MTVEIHREHALKCLDTLPPFSPVLNRLLGEMSSDYISMSELSAIMERDTIIAGNVLKIANSAAYGRREDVTSVCHAATLLGMERLRNAVLGMSVTRMWNRVEHPRSFSKARFNLHSIATAVLSDLMAQRVAVNFPEGAFLAGLFHDLGRLLLAVGLSGLYTEVLAYQSGSHQPWSDCEFEVLGFTHAEISEAACAKWRLPAAIIAAVGAHHDGRTSDSSLPFGTFPLSAIVGEASRYANFCGISVEASEIDDESLKPSESLRALGLEEEIPEIDKEFRIQFEPLSSFFK